MAKNDYVPPEFKSQAFTCPHCDVRRNQSWEELYYISGEDSFHASSYDSLIDNGSQIYGAVCSGCKRVSIWRNIDENSGEMVYPTTLFGISPVDDMPEEVLEFYNEARGVASISPRAAAVLLRVSLEKLTEHLGEKEGGLNKRIGALKKKGFPESIIRSLDCVRIIANEGGAHAGIIGLIGEDGKREVEKLFWLANAIVERVISDPKNINKYFGDLPEEKKKGIINRDKNP